MPTESEDEAAARACGQALLRGVYLKGAILLHEALTHPGRQWRALEIDAAHEIGARLFDIQKRRLDRTVPGWHELFSPELVPSGLRG